MCIYVLLVANAAIVHFPIYIANEEDMERDHCETNCKITFPFCRTKIMLYYMFKVLAINVRVLLTHHVCGRLYLVAR